MIGPHRATKKQDKSNKFLAPLDPAYFGEVQLAKSLRRASELVDHDEAAEIRARSMARHPSTQPRRKRPGKVA
jgi:hypothetical protein